MDFEYRTTVCVRDVIFYVTAGGQQAYFVSGGSVYGTSRPEKRGDAAPIVKFGLTVKCRPSSGLGGAALTRYVQAECKRRGLRGGSAAVQGNDVFLDTLEQLNHDPSCNERTLCGRTAVHVRDPAVAEHLVGMGVTAGLMITSVADKPSERVLRLLHPPEVSNAYSGFRYDAHPDSFGLVQAALGDPPQCLVDLIDGLFDGIPETRETLHEADVPHRVDVVVTSDRSAKTVTICPGQPAGSAFPENACGALASPLFPSPPMSRGEALEKPAAGDVSADRAVGKGLLKKRGAKRAPNGSKSARICNYVQVKFIDPCLDLWTPTADHQAAAARRDSPRRLLGDLSSAFYCATMAMDPETPPWPGMSDAMYEAREKMAAVAEAVFGQGAARFLFSAADSGLSPAQKLLIFQYAQFTQGLPNCYGYALELCNDFRISADAFAEDSAGKTDAADKVADATSDCFRACLFMGAASEVLATVDHRSSNFLNGCVSRSPSTGACMDADLLLDLAAFLTGDEATVCAERETRLLKLAVVLDAVYDGEALITAAARESKAIGNSELLCVTIDIVSTCAFQYAPRLRCLGAYANALFDARLKEAQLPSYYA